MKFGHSMEVDDTEFDLEGLGHMSKVEVTMLTQVKVKCHLGQDEKSC